MYKYQDSISLTNKHSHITHFFFFNEQVSTCPMSNTCQVCLITYHIVLKFSIDENIYSRLSIHNILFFIDELYARL